MPHCLKRLPIRCCWGFSLHQGYIYIVYCDYLKTIINLLYAATAFIRYSEEPSEVILLLLILFLTLLEAFIAYISLRGFSTNDWRKHLLYFAMKIVFMTIVTPAVLVVEQIECNYSSSSSKTCPVLSSITQFILLCIEGYFTYIVYTIYRKTRKGYYGPLGSAPCLAVVSKTNVFTLNPRAVVVEVEGDIIKQNKKARMDKGEFNTHTANTFDDDLRAINVHIPTNHMDRETDYNSIETKTVVSINIEKRIKRQFNKTYIAEKPKVYRDKQTIKLEQVNLMNLK